VVAATLYRLPLSSPTTPKHVAQIKRSCGIWYVRQTVRVRWGLCGGNLWTTLGRSRTVKVPEPNCSGGCLVWIWRDLVKLRRVHLEDCFPVSRVPNIDRVPMRLSIERDFCAAGWATFVDILKRALVAEGGRWVKQANKPPQTPSRERFQMQRGRGV
jgi:hypothetical protein